MYSVTGENSLSTTTTAPPAGRELICIYMWPQIVEFRAATNDYFDNRLVDRLFFRLIG